jgi:hypothetical protein
MLRLRLSLDCGCVSAATQGRPGNGFTVEITRPAQDHDGSDLHVPREISPADPVVTQTVAFTRRFFLTIRLTPKLRQTVALGNRPRRLPCFTRLNDRLHCLERRRVFAQRSGCVRQAFKSLWEKVVIQNAEVHLVGPSCLDQPVVHLQGPGLARLNQLGYNFIAIERFALDSSL